MKKLALAASVAALLSTSAQADMLLGLYIGGQAWNAAASGQMGEGSDQVDFGLKDKTQGSYYAALEHPIPLVPNLRIGTTTLATTGSSTIDVDLWGKTYDEKVNTDFDVSYNDYTLYYELFDNGLFSFDFGITARDFDGVVTVESESDSTNSSGVEMSAILPMAYVHTNVGIPATGFNIYGTGNLLSIGDHSLYDYEVGVSYELIDNLAVDINLTAGYKVVALELDDLDELTSDLQFKGVFVGAVVHF